MGGKFKSRALTAEEVDRAVGWYVVDLRGIDTIAREFGVTRRRVIRSLEAAGVMVGGPHGRTGRRRGAKMLALKISDEEIVRRYEAGETRAAIAAAAGCRDGTIKWRLRHYGIDPRARFGSVAVPMPEAQVAEARRLYEQGFPVSRIARRLHVGYRRLRRCLELRRRSRGRRVPERWTLSDDEIIRRYLAGESGDELAEVLGCASTTIYRIMKRRGIARRSCGRAAALRRKARLDGSGRFGITSTDGT